MGDIDGPRVGLALGFEVGALEGERLGRLVGLRVEMVEPTGAWVGAETGHCCLKLYTKYCCATP